MIKHVNNHMHFQETTRSSRYVVPTSGDVHPSGKWIWASAVEFWPSSHVEPFERYIVSLVEAKLNCK